jgi:serralysin
MAIENTNPVYDILGTAFADTISGGAVNSSQTLLPLEQVVSNTTVIKANGKEGDDTIITADANDLAAGDMVGNEWAYVGGKWVFDASKLVVSNYGLNKSFNDVIHTGAGNDVLLGNGGNDKLFAGAGNDIINAGTGDDMAYGGEGNDLINLESGNDFAEGGLGNDTINGGDGKDVIYGDNKGDNLLAASATATSFDSLVRGGAWTMTDAFGQSMISQSAATVAGATYTVSFELAANFAGGFSSGGVEVLWNGVVVDTVQVTSGAFQTFEVDVTSTGEQGALSFRSLEADAPSHYDFSGPIVSYAKDVAIGGETVSVDAFAAGQAKLYQVIDGQLNVFDTQEKTYVAVGDAPNFKINAVGFNVEDDLIYGVAKSVGTDSLGHAVKIADIVMIDASGDTYRVGKGTYADFVGDFDEAGNLWTFDSSMNRVSVVDVDQLDANGNPQITNYNLNNNLFTSNIYDIAYNAKDGSFYAVVSSTVNGGAGSVVKIDVSNVEQGGQPSFSSIDITGTLYGDHMESGIAKGAFGAVFLDGDGNLYYGLNNGDFDLDSSTAANGAIFKVNMDWDAGHAYAEFMSEAPATGSNDGAVDPRSVDAFAEVDANAAVLIREPALVLVEGGNDVLRGGAGDDEVHGNAGNDTLNGGTGDDALYGDQGNDNMSGDDGDDQMSGGAGNDSLLGGNGDDVLNGDDGQDYLAGGAGDDELNGGAGVDKIVGGTGADIINGGAGNDNLWGGNWSADGSQDTFVFTSGTGKDYVFDFETAFDLIDLTAFGTTFEAVAAVTTDLGWATMIDLQQLSGGQADDRVVLSNVHAADMTADVFIF